MAYMDKNSFEIWTGSNIHGRLDNSFEIDEVIAPVVQALNRKGYKTTFCCSGHPGASIDEVVYFPPASDDVDPWHVVYNTVSVNKNEDGSYTITYIMDDDELYIAFDEAVSVPNYPEIPEGCFWDENSNTIRYSFENAGHFGFLRERIEINEKLLSWALALPPLSS